MWQRRIRVKVSSYMCSRAVISLIKSSMKGRQKGFHRVRVGNGNMFESITRWALSRFRNKWRRCGISMRCGGVSIGMWKYGGLLDKVHASRLGEELIF